MRKDYGELVEEIDQLKSRLSRIEDTLAEYNLSTKESGVVEDKVTQLVKRARLRAAQMAKEMTEEEVWSFYEKTVAALKKESKNKKRRDFR
jgi:gamma-glutamylcysteine synthetase